MRKASRDVQHKNQYADLDIPPTPKHPKRVIKPISGPSKEHMEGVKGLFLLAAHIQLELSGQ